jgi:hypothetical protein
MGYVKQQTTNSENIYATCIIFRKNETPPPLEYTLSTPVTSTNSTVLSHYLTSIALIREHKETIADTAL